MESVTRTITGKVEKNPYGSWDDCSPGIYLDRNEVQSIFDKYRGKTLRVTIEVMPEPETEENAAE